MRNPIIIACLLISCSPAWMNAQDSIKKKMINAARVTLISNPTFQSRGALYQVNDSSIMLSNSFNAENYAFGNQNFSINEIDIIDIQFITIKSKQRTRKAALIGAASGFIIGLVWAGIESQQPAESWVIGPTIPAWSEALLGGALGASVGVLSGALIGSIGIHIPVNGSMDHFKRKKAQLAKYALKH